MIQQYAKQMLHGVEIFQDANQVCLGIFVYLFMITAEFKSDMTVEIGWNSLPRSKNISRRMVCTIFDKSH